MAAVPVLAMILPMLHSYHAWCRWRRRKRGRYRRGNDRICARASADSGSIGLGWSRGWGLFSNESIRCCRRRRRGWIGGWNGRQGLRRCLWLRWWRWWRRRNRRRRWERRRFDNFYYCKIDAHHRNIPGTDSISIPNLADADDVSSLPIWLSRFRYLVAEVSSGWNRGAGA